MAAYVKGHESAGPAPMILTIAGVSVAVISFVVLSLYARRVVKRTLREQEEELPSVVGAASPAAGMDPGKFAGGAGINARGHSAETQPLLSEDAEGLP